MFKLISINYLDLSQFVLYTNTHLSMGSTKSCLSIQIYL